MEPKAELSLRIILSLPQDRGLGLTAVRPELGWHWYKERLGGKDAAHR